LAGEGPLLRKKPKTKQPDPSPATSRRQRSTNIPDQTKTKINLHPKPKPQNLDQISPAAAPRRCWDQQKQQTTPDGLFLVCICCRQPHGCSLFAPDGEAHQAESSVLESSSSPGPSWGQVMELLDGSDEAPPKTLEVGDNNNKKPFSQTLHMVSGLPVIMPC
jgi:hypothetical protein